MNKIEELYQRIGNKLVGIIPDEWDKIYLYAEILPGSRIVYFYYNSTTRNELIFGQSIPEIYGVDDQIYNRLDRELVEYFVELNQESLKSSPEPWTNLTMYLDQSENLILIIVTMKFSSPLLNNLQFGSMKI